jgi:iron complex transport system ATP-binding protein
VAAVEEQGVSVPMLQAESLCIDAGGRRLCSGLDLQVRSGEFWCVIGRNGAGKSTLLHTLAGLNNPREGRVLLAGSDIRSIAPAMLARRRGLLPQQQFDAFSSSVLDTVVAGRYPHLAGLGWDSDEDRAAASHALSAVGMADSAGKDVMTLSGGERQRVALATLLAQDPDVLLLDEPTAHQDAAAQLAVMALVRSMADKAVVAACHDINLVSRFATHVLVLADDMHCAGPVHSVLTPAVLQHAFGCRFDVLDGACGRLFIPFA